LEVDLCFTVVDDFGGCAYGGFGGFVDRLVLVGFRRFGPRRLFLKP
jgi:hypothetical protein